MATKNNVAAGFKRNLIAVDLTDDNEEIAPPVISTPALSNYAVKQIPFELLESNHFQAQLRPEGTEQEDLKELAENMTINGFTSTILVRPNPAKPGYYELGYGHRRLAALKLAAKMAVEPNKVKDWNKIPARIAEAATDREWLDIAISENLSRKDLSPIAIAKSFEAIRTQNPGASLAEIARRVGRSKSFVQRHDAINGAPAFLVDMVEKKPDSLEHLFILKNLSDPNRQRELARQVLKGDLTLAALKEQVESKKSIHKLDITKDTSLPSNSRLNGIINHLENSASNLYRQLEQENFYLSFDQQAKIENIVTQLKELTAMTRPASSKQD